MKPDLQKGFIDPIKAEVQEKIAVNVDSLLTETKEEVIHKMTDSYPKEYGESSLAIMDNNLEFEKSCELLTLDLVTAMSD